MMRNEDRRPRPAGVLGGARPAAYTVAAVNAMVRHILDSNVGPLWVQGEVTGWKRHTSGHCYFALRDRNAQMRAVMFRAEAQRLPADPEEGMEVRVLGRVTLYEPRGEYQFVVREIEGLGAGGLWRLAFERLHRKLDAEGLFAAERKRALPRFPSTVAVVTSPVGAALHDIVQVIGTRAPWTRVVLSPAKVQGDGAPSDIARAIRLVARYGGADVIIVGRGGGSVEDLWAFNDEVVARTIANSPIPVISAVGHEVDVTIADLVADWRAPTPSAAAERAVPDRAAVLRELAALARRLPAGLYRTVEQKRTQLQRLDSWLVDAARSTTRLGRDRLERAMATLDALSPLGALRRGYAVPLHDGHVLRTVQDFPPGAHFTLRVTDGEVNCHSDGGSGTVLDD
jgi:exodeoxyribonuclease VII large subunit